MVQKRMGAGGSGYGGAPMPMGGGVGGGGSMLPAPMPGVGARKRTPGGPGSIAPVPEPPAPLPPDVAPIPGVGGMADPMQTPLMPGTEHAYLQPDAGAVDDEAPAGAGGVSELLKLILAGRGSSVPGAL